MKSPFEGYTGADPYWFISYAHKDIHELANHFWRKQSPAKWAPVPMGAVQEWANYRGSGNSRKLRDSRISVSRVGDSRPATTSLI